MLRSLSSAAAAPALAAAASASASATRSSLAHASGIAAVTIVGSGIMGAGIAQVSAHHGKDVRLVDLSEENLARGKAAIEGSLKRVLKKEADVDAAVADVMARITFTSSMEEALKGSDLLVEAVYEDPETKRQIFGVAQQYADDECIFATNTSSLSVNSICNGVRPERFGGLHFFNPVPMLKLVEVIKTDETSDATADALREFAAEVGKEPIVCKDTPGFVVNRLLVPYLQSAVDMMERGDASKEDIDKAMKLGAGMPMGPFELLDVIGLDTAALIINSWVRTHGDTFNATPAIDKLVSDGKFGRKNGEGFYKY
ncbi:hydroxyacyl-Coenzyme A dehydrogenase [Thecamonas trahens ATCC 50062]|uniref:3-hydroxyacyl-CoA dehydrogenase n=1 Tax=Thecamonas trahens ATCC 50062 TaxID=461836 RepID=A0A0L0DHH6_THETB|nr:hydroxyacyl-Coenzyme A dehydrogenase [Thecamonas trahens ATCC 50062]KNC51665.1 hydroxyacyl-Coenzyme A dehydrogenase [Thecamonas trahens ATCC 50062]|eukprot:XP_013755800.1 hydroxyacyl-Coenzyme A dehydrogenase [Thecamonas trahens ATCC 50062]